MPGPVTNVDDIFSVIYDCLYLGQQVMTTLCYRVKTVGGSPPVLTDMYDAIVAKLDSLGGVSAAYAAMFTTDLTDIKIHVQKIYPTRWVKQTDYSTISTGQRTPVTPLLPASGAGALTLRSIAAAPEGRGTKHILATSGDDIASGEISEEFRGLLQDFGDIATAELTLAAPASGTVIAPVIYHRANPVLSLQADWAVVQPHSRIMRRRTVGQGS